MKIEIKDFVQYLTIKKKLAASSVHTYKIRFLVLKRWLAENKFELDKLSLETFLFEKKEEGKSNAAVNTYIQTIGHIDGFCKDRSLPFGFSEGLENLPKTKSEIIILSVDEINKLVHTELGYKNRNGVDCSDLDLKYRTLTHFLAQTGCRFEEAASLKAKRLDISNGKATLVKTKNKDNRYVYFNGPIKEDLEYLLKGKNLEELVFTNSKGQHIKPGDFNNDLRKRAETAGIINPKRVHAHLLRHSFATNLIVAGVDLTIVSTLLGHKDIQTTFETYVHLADETLKKAALRNPLLRQYADPSEIIKMVKSAIESLKLGEDKRFNFQIQTNQELNSYGFQISIA